MGGPALLKEESAEVPPALQNAVEVAAARGQASIYLLRNGRGLAGFTIADAIRPESHDAVRSLHERGHEVSMLTGNARDVAIAVADERGIDTDFAKVLTGNEDTKDMEITT